MVDPAEQLPPGYNQVAPVDTGTYSAEECPGQTVPTP